MPYFILCFLLISWWFNYFQIFDYAPYADHNWRQADCTSFVQTYYNEGMKFFQPKVHFNNFVESRACPSEFPILYYLTAGIWKISNPHDGILRLLNYLIFLWGCFSISRMILDLTKDNFYALAVPIFLMGSPVMAFYAFNFLPNIPALGLAFLGVGMFYNFYKKEKPKWLVGSIIAFTFAGLLKVTILIPFFAIFGIFILEQTNLVQFKSEGKIFKKGWQNIFLFFSSLAIVLGWVLWVKNYNDVYSSGIFITKANPIWGLKEPAITQTWHWILREGLHEYFNLLSRWFILIATILSLIFFGKKMPKTIYGFNLLNFLGILAIFFLFYRQFFVHDYYAIEMMIFPISVLITFFYVFKKSFPAISNHWVTKSIIAIFLIFNLNYAQKNLANRYDRNQIFSKEFDVSISKKIEVQNWLKSIGIEYPMRILGAPDISPNFMLNYFNVRGWTEYAMPLERDEKNNFRLFTPHHLQSFRTLGADFLIITDKRLLEHQNFQEHIKYPLGNFENTIFAFDLRPIPKTEN